MKKQQSTLGLPLLIAACVLCVFLPFKAWAQQSELQQEILEPDCSLPGSCEMKAPTINFVSKAGGRPVITGTYDTAFTKSLRVTFGGIVYALSEGSQLTARNGMWRLDLHALARPLAVGVYELIIETTGYDESVQRVQATITITEADIAAPREPAPAPGEADDSSEVPPDTPEEAGDTPVDVPQSPVPQPQPIAKSNRESLISVISLAAMLVLTGATYATLAITRKRRAAAKKDMV